MTRRHPAWIWPVAFLAAAILLLVAATPTHGQAATDNFDASNIGSIFKAAGSALPDENGDGNFHVTISIVLLLTVLTLAPAILVMCTSFTQYGNWPDVCLSLRPISEGCRTSRQPPHPPSIFRYTGSTVYFSPSSFTQYVVMLPSSVGIFTILPLLTS